MKLSSLNTSRLPGPGDFGEPPEPDGFAPFLEADAILAEATTAAGARAFANEIDPESIESLVLTCAITISLHGDHDATIGKIVSRWMRDMSMAIVDKRHREGRL